MGLFDRNSGNGNVSTPFNPPPSGGGGGGGSPGGSSGAVQFNASGSFGGDSSRFFWNDSNKYLAIGDMSNGSIASYINGTGAKFYTIGTPNGYNMFLLSENPAYGGMALGNGPGGGFIQGVQSDGSATYDLRLQYQGIGKALIGTTGNETHIRSSVFKIQDGSQGTVGYLWTQTQTDGTGSWVSSKQWATEKFTLSATDITNQYVDLAHVAMTNSVFSTTNVSYIFAIEGSSASDHFTISYTGGSGGNTRFSFSGQWASGGGADLVAGNVLVIKYQY